MKWALWLGRILARQLAPQGLVNLAVEVWPHVWKRIPPDQRVGFLKSAAEKYLGTFLGDLNREERVALMNALLPIAAREFPLSEIDFLSAFTAPGDRYNPENLDK